MKTEIDDACHRRVGAQLLHESYTMCMISATSTHAVAAMRTNIDIDDKLLARAMKASGQSTKRATVEEGLRVLVRLGEQKKALESLRGLGWEGDLDEMREGWRFEDHDSC